MTDAQKAIKIYSQVLINFEKVRYSVKRIQEHTNKVKKIISEKPCSHWKSPLKVINQRKQKLVKFFNELDKDIKEINSLVEIPILIEVESGVADSIKNATKKCTNLYQIPVTNKEVSFEGYIDSIIIDWELVSKQIEVLNDAIHGTASVLAKSTMLEGENEL